MYVVTGIKYARMIMFDIALWIKKTTIKCYGFSKISGGMMS